MRLLKYIALAMLLGWGHGVLAGTLLIVGDSISAGFGVETGKGWVSLLVQRLADQGFDDQVVNASISGDTTAGGLSRLPALLTAHQPDIVILELGGNDGLRGLSTVQMKQNLSTMLDAICAAGAEPLLVGMRVPPNLGARYTAQFAEVFTALAQEHGVASVPFLLDGVWNRGDWMQGDHIHPAELGQPRLLENIWHVLQPLLLSRGTTSSCGAQRL